MKKSNNDMVSTGVIIGFVLPAIFITAFIIYSSSRFESIEQTVKYFIYIGLMYKVVSLSLMPGVGLFFYWNKKNKVNMSRGLLLSTLFYGILVLVLYMS